MPERVDASKLSDPKYIGRMVCFFNTEKFVGKIERVDEEEGYIYFEQVGGKDHGQKFRVRYDQEGKNIKVFEPEEEVLALLE